MTNKVSHKTINSLIAVALIAIFVCFLALRSGAFDKTPVVDITADNCYEDTLYVITDQDYKPYSFLDEKGNYSGHDVELITYIANKLKMNLDLKFLPWNEGIAAATEGKCDLLMTCDYSDSFAGTDQLIKSEPISMDDYIVYSKNDINSINELYNKKIGLMKNGNVTTLIKMLNLMPLCTQYINNREAMKGLVNNETDVVIMRNTVGKNLIAELEISDVEAKFSIGQSYMCFGIYQGDSLLVGEINDALEACKTDGTITKLKDKWLTSFVQPYTVGETIANNIWIVFAFIGLGILLMLIVLRNKDRQIKSQKELEEAKNQLEIANRAKTDFLFNMSHDIRTPMNAIIGFTNLAKKYKNEPEKVNCFLSNIELSSNHLLNLINEVLDMSRVEAGKLKSEIKTVDIRDAASHLITICKDTAAAKNVELSLICNDLKHPVVKADELHINQVIMNILGNAIKYTMNGGSVVYTIDELPSDKTNYGYYEFTIKDTGIGMTKEFLTKIFDSFSREETQAANGVQGTGLGMSIVKRLVDYMDGTINIESEQGKGTTVKVRFHLTIDDGITKTQSNKDTKDSISDSQEASAYRSAATDGKSTIIHEKPRVLIVEDNELNREICTELLLEHELEVEEATNGLEAVDTVKRKGTDYYDLILMDIQMPFLNGYEATKQIRNLEDQRTKRSSRRVPIIALSANAFEEDRRTSLDAGMNGHIAKPIDTGELKETLAKYCKTN